MADVASEVSMERTLDQVRRQKRMENEKKSRGLLQRMGRGKAARYGKTAALAAMLSSQALGGAGAAMKEIDAGPADQQKTQQVDPSRAGNVSQQLAALPEEEAFKQFAASQAATNAASQEEENQSLSPDEQIDRGRKLYRQTQAARRASNQLPTKPPSASAGAKAAQAGGAAAKAGSTAAAARGAAAGPAGLAATVALQKLRNEVRKNKALAKKASIKGTAEAQALANIAIKKSMRTAWTLVHETLENTALSFLDFMVISGPFTILVFILRLFAPLYNKLATFRFRGIEVPLIPSFTLQMLVPRAAKTLLVAMITFIVYSSVYLLFYFATHKVEALKFITQTFLDTIL
ncbi:hypothetical protein ACFL0L_01145 [Patescibacteria group bacterium]